VALESWRHQGIGDAAEDLAPSQPRMRDSLTDKHCLAMRGVARSIHEREVGFNFTPSNWPGSRLATTEKKPTHDLPACLGWETVEISMAVEQ